MQGSCYHRVAGGMAKDKKIRLCWMMAMIAARDPSIHLRNEPRQDPFFGGTVVAVGSMTMNMLVLQIE